MALAPSEPRVQPSTPAAPAGVAGGTSRPIRRAFSGAVVEGVTLYLPLGVGILAIGIPACALGSFLHFVLAVSMPVSGALVASLGALARVLKRVRRGA